MALSENSGTSKLGTYHWWLQAVPPICVLAPLFGTRSGAALVFLVGFFLIPVLVSLVSIVFKLLAFKQRKYFLLRPTLTILFFLLVLSIAHWSYSVALEDATNAALRVHQQCQSDGVCPAAPEGWSVDERRISRRDLGKLYKYSASYYYQPESFLIRVYQGPDLGDVIRGGVDAPFSVEPYVEDHARSTSETD